MNGSWVKEAVPVNPQPGQALAALGHPAYALGAVLDRPQNAPRLVVQKLPRGSQADLARGPGEQRRAQLRLQLPDRLGESRLGHVQSLGRTAEVARLGDSDEIAQVTQLHEAQLLGGAGPAGGNDSR